MAQFISAVERLVREKGAAVLLDAAKCRAHLADYAHNAFKKERHLLLIALEAGAGKEIARAGDLAICKKQLIRFLNEERFIDKTLAAEAIDLLALVLRADRAESLAARRSARRQSSRSKRWQRLAAIRATRQRHWLRRAWNILGSGRNGTTLSGIFFPYSSLLGLRDVAIQAAVQFPGTPKQADRPLGLPRRFAPRNDGRGSYWHILK